MYTRCQVGKVIRPWVQYILCFSSGYSGDGAPFHEIPGYPWIPVYHEKDPLCKPHVQRTSNLKVGLCLCVWDLVEFLQSTDKKRHLDVIFVIFSPVVELAA